MYNLAISDINSLGKEPREYRRPYGRRYLKSVNKLFTMPEVYPDFGAAYTYEGVVHKGTYHEVVICHSSMKDLESWMERRNYTYPA